MAWALAVWSFVERIEQALVILVKQSVPDRTFDPVAVGCAGIAAIACLVDAGLRHKIEQALPFAVIEIVAVFGRAIPDGCDFRCGGLARLRVAQIRGEAEAELQNANQDDSQRRAE
jgi:hypothetical protein